MLATASHRRLADGIAAHLGLFDEVLATDASQNLAGAKEGELLAARFGVRGFDYVGDGRRDLHVWSMARNATVVSSSAGLIEAARRVAAVVRVIPRSRPGVAVYLKSLRLHQWLKNILVFVPILAAHRFDWSAGLVKAGLAFVSFGLCGERHRAIVLVSRILDVHPSQPRDGEALFRIAGLSSQQRDSCGGSVNMRPLTFPCRCLPAPAAGRPPCR